MRDRIDMQIGGEVVSLLPAYSVIDAFEDRYFGLPEHLDRLVSGRATIQQRAFLILQGAVAADPTAGYKLADIQTGMFEVGYWHEDLVNLEVRFIERLLYTPEQYLAKKSAREKTEKAVLDELAGSFSKGTLASPPPT